MWENVLFNDDQMQTGMKTNVTRHIKYVKQIATTFTCYFFIAYIKKDKLLTCEIFWCDFLIKNMSTAFFVTYYRYNSVYNYANFNSLEIVKVHGILYFENYPIVSILFKVCKRLLLLCIHQFNKAFGTMPNLSRQT